MAECLTQVFIYIEESKYHRCRHKICLHATLFPSVCIYRVLLGFKRDFDVVYRKTGGKTYDLNMDDAAIIAGSFGLPVNLESRFNLELL